MFRFDSYHISLDALGVVSFFVVISFLLRLRNFQLERRHATYISIAWIAVWSIEYWIFGDRSYIHYNTLSAGFSTNLLYSGFEFGQVFSHIPAGGMDLFSASQIAGSYLSLESLILKFTPNWAANALHEALVVTVAFVGLYKCCRSIPFSCDRYFSLSAAALYTFAQKEVYESSWNHGLGYAIIPLASYLLIQRFSCRLYWLGALIASIVIAVSSNPTHSELALLMSLICVAVLINPKRLWVFAPALVVHLLFLFANYHEAIYAKLIYAPLSERGNHISSDTIYTDHKIYFLLAALSIAALIRYSERKYFIPSVALIMSLFLWAPLKWFAINLGEVSALQAVNVGRCSSSFPFISTLVLALAYRCFLNHNKPKLVLGFLRYINLKRLVASSLAAMALGSLVWLKAYNVTTWLRHGGLSPHTRLMTDISERPWRSSERLRTAIFSLRISEFALAAAGVDTFSGTLNIAPYSLTSYWDRILYPYKSDANSGYLRLRRPDLDFYCCNEYNLAQYADLNLLRIANVGFVYSFLPLTGRGITQVAGPTGKSNIPRNSDTIFDKFKGYKNQIFDHDHLRVYSLETALPRVFVATSIKVIDKNTDNSEFYNQVRFHALNRVAVVHEAHTPIPVFSGSSLTLKSYQLLPDGIRANVYAPKRGILIFNTPYVIFWKAFADGKEIQPFPVNGIHTAVAVPKNTSKIILKYSRPLLRERLAEFFTTYALRFD